MAVVHEQNEKTPSKLERTAATTLRTIRRLGKGAIGVIDIIPPSGAHAYRRGRVQLGVDQTRPTEPKHSKDTADLFLSVEGAKQEPERPHTLEELNHQPLLTHQDHMPTPGRPSWIEDEKTPH